MRYAGILIILLSLTSCSAQWKSTFLIPAPLDGALSVELHNWETELYGGPSFGHVRPEIYGYKLDDVYYFIYPREIATTGTMGPPIIPLGLSVPRQVNDKYTLFALRLFNPNNSYRVAPIRMSLFNNSNLQVTCLLASAVQDAAGIEYKCTKEQAFPETQPSKLVIEFSNQHSIEFPVELTKVSGYSPIFSFNGPNPSPKVVIHEKNGSINSPK